MWDRLYRFRLEHCDVVSTLGNVTDLLRFMALNIDGRDKAPPIIAAVLMAVGLAICFYVYVISMFYVVFWLETEDLVGAMIVFSVSMFTCVTMVKLFFLYLNSELVEQTVAAFVSCDKRVAADSRMHRNRLLNMRTIKRRAMMVWAMIVTNGCLYNARPFLMPGRHLVDDRQTVYGLEPKYESPNYELSLLVVEIAVLLMVCVCATITSLFIVLSGYIEAQMLALSDEMLHLWADARTIETTGASDDRKPQNQYIKNQLNSIVQTHAASLTLLRLTDSIFSKSIATEFCLLGMGIIADLLGGLENTYIEMPYGLAQVLIDCYIGQRLMEASITFREAVYSCSWEEFDAPNRKTVLMILKNSQTMVLSAGGIAQLNYTTLMSVIKSIYSTYAALRSTMKD